MIVLLIAFLVFAAVSALAYWLAGKRRCGQYPKCECGVLEDCVPLADDLRGTGFADKSLHTPKAKEFVSVNPPPRTTWSEVRNRYSVSDQPRPDDSIFTPACLAPLIVASTMDDDTLPYVPITEQQAIAEVESIEPSRLDAGHHTDSYHDSGSSYHHDSSSHFDSGSGFSSSDY